MDAGDGLLYADHRELFKDHLTAVIQQGTEHHELITHLTSEIALILERLERLEARNISLANPQRRQTRRWHAVKVNQENRKFAAAVDPQLASLTTFSLSELNICLAQSPAMTGTVTHDDALGERHFSDRIIGGRRCNRSLPEQLARRYCPYTRVYSSRH
jgi:hypothetical protein